MKGQDEIKKALSLCPGDSLECEQDGCPYWDIRLCVPELHIDALELLKEQKAVKPVTESSVYDPDTWFFVCGSCKKGVIDCGDKFCRWCGQAVKWE